MLAALEAVDCVVVFDEETPLELIQALQPDVLVKGADYTRTPPVGADMVEAARRPWSGTSTAGWLLEPLPSWSVSVPRPDGRANDQLRPVVLERKANPYAEGSCLIRMGGTLVHCTARVEPGVPGFKKGSGEGWVTAEYAMLPRATSERTDAGAQRARVAGLRRSSG